MKRWLILVVEILLVSGLVGLIISGFQFLAHEVIHYANILVQNDNVLIVVAVFLIMIIISIFLIFINKKIPGHTGSGVPQFEAYHEGWYDINPLYMFCLVGFNSLVAFFGGFLLGGEGPSITLGQSIGLYITRLFNDEDKEMVASAGSAGFACAFLAPVAGLMHLIEENKKILNWHLLIKGIFIIGISSLITYFIYNHNLLPIYSEQILPFKYYYLLPFVIILGLVFGKLYILAIIKTKDVVKKVSFWSYLLPFFMIFFLLLRRYYPLLIGTGGDILATNMIDYSLWLLLGILVFRLVFTALSANQTISGGLVLPMLAVGALVGDIIVALFSYLDNDILLYKDTIIACSMLVVFAVVCKTPLTALILGFKVGTFKAIFLPLAFSLLFAYLIVILLRWNNIYKELEKRLPGHMEVEDGTI